MILRDLSYLPLALLIDAPFVPLDGVVNNASYLPACAPNGGVAPGSLFAVFGRDIGPALDGLSVRIAMDGSTYEAAPLYASATQIGAVLPSTVPPGDGRLTVTYLGRSADAVPIRVRPSAPGIFVVDPQTLRPGQIATVWATGLGASQEARVWVGDRLARILYSGPSGCCAGVDQINFEVPAGIEGCQVPLNVEAGGVASNFTSIAINCVPAKRLPPPVSVDRFGLILFLDGFGSMLLPGAGDDYVRLGFFHRGRVQGDVEAPLYAFEPNAEVPVNSCSVRYGTQFPAQPTQPDQTPLDAGPELHVSGAGGSFRLLRNGSYQDPQRIPIPPGRYKIDNGPGGPGVGPFSFETDAIAIKLLSQPQKIVRGEDLTLTWDYQGPSGQLLTIFGSTNSCGRGLFSFSCVARATDRRFVVPARILSLLPPSTSFFGVSNGALNISTTSPGGLRRFAAPGLDLGLYLQLSISAIRPTYE
jgi:uncharacterized protein (TIGR03437 family)